MGEVITNTVSSFNPVFYSWISSLVNCTTPVVAFQLSCHFWIVCSLVASLFNLIPAVLLQCRLICSSTNRRIWVIRAMTCNACDDAVRYALMALTRNFLWVFVSLRSYQVFTIHSCHIGAPYCRIDLYMYMSSCFYCVQYCGLPLYLDYVRLKE